MSPLDTPFDKLTFRVDDNGKSYLVGVQDLCSQPLNEGLLEHSYMEPEEWSHELADMRQEELERISSFEVMVSMMWGRPSWTLLTPTPSADAREFQDPDRIFGRLCAAVLKSFDPFPVPYRGERGEEPADYSEACVLYFARRSEGLLPESVRKLIRWEGIAKPHLV